MNVSEDIHSTVENGSSPSLDEHVTDTGTHDPTPESNELGQNQIPDSSNQKHSNRKWPTLRVETRQILFICSLTLVPMIAFTIVTLWLIFHYRIGVTTCPFPQLCLQHSELNISRYNFAVYYYIDYPAAQLAFIASLSSSLSFTLVGALMATFSYTSARQLLRLSVKKKNNCPTPYNTSMLLRILNAEVMALFDIITSKFKEIFWELKKQDEEQKENATMVWILHTSVIVFVVSICAR
jgi:hypothetical protein